MGACINIKATGTGPQTPGLTKYKCDVHVVCLIAGDDIKMSRAPIPADLKQLLE